MSEREDRELEERDEWSGWEEGVDRIGRKRDRLARLLAVT
jgi:hypothetical protein